MRLYETEGTLGFRKEKLTGLSMKINVGSKNPVKIAGVRDAVNLYPSIFPDAEVVGVEVGNAEFGHPKNLAETIQGAIQRAKGSFIDCSYGFGLESGMMEVPSSKTGFMEVTVCAIYDGEKISLGLSPALEWPKEVTELVVSGVLDGSQAFKKLGFTRHEKMGTQPGGIISVLTKGRITREELTKDSIIMALVQLEHPELY